MKRGQSRCPCFFCGDVSWHERVGGEWKAPWAPGRAALGWTGRMQAFRKMPHLLYPAWPRDAIAVSARKGLGGHLLPLSCVGLARGGRVLIGWQAFRKGANVVSQETISADVTWEAEQHHDKDWILKSGYLGFYFWFLYFLAMEIQTNDNAHLTLRITWFWTHENPNSARDIQSSNLSVIIIIEKGSGREGSNMYLSKLPKETETLTFTWKF